VEKEILEKYKNEYEKYLTDIVDKDGKRVYNTPNNAKYFSVTTVLSEMSDKTWLETWKNNIGEEKAKEITKNACNRGYSMHKIIEDSFNGLDIDINAEGYKYYRQLTLQLKHVQPYALELPLWSDKLRIAGRTDCIGLYKGNLSVIDYKTSRRPKKSSEIENYFLQCAIYSLMLYERTNIHCKDIVILMATDDGFPQVFIRKTKDYIKQSVKLINTFHKLQVDSSKI
jgi:genome maintenance exonuclease 1